MRPQKKVSANTGVTQAALHLQPWKNSRMIQPRSLAWLPEDQVSGKQSQGNEYGPVRDGPVDELLGVMLFLTFTKIKSLPLPPPNDKIPIISIPV